MTPEERKDRIKYLARKEDRKKRLPGLLKDLMEITQEVFTENDVLTLEQIDALKTNINASGFNFTHLNLSFPKNQSEDLKKLLSEMVNELSQTNYFRLYSFSDIAVLTTNTNFIIHNFEEIINLDQDLFTVYDSHLENGLWIDLNEEFRYEINNSERIWIYEVRIFGKDWIKKVSAKL
ncbi:hypothetical protein ACI6PS_06435 [Flavobacterium sp. PLA-1-15]|uniref:hypothetical protein n=1 Tax=Flavobacterium sp. PLA-1-15 TaxID=3380533 RepID=UPI003B81DD9F